MTNEEAEAILDKAWSALGEHFDGSVRIFVTWTSDKGTGNTLSLCRGTGNFYAALGQVREWLLINDERARLDTRKHEETE